MRTSQAAEGVAVIEDEDSRRVTNLFTPGERFGWTYREQPPMRPCALTGPGPYRPSEAAAGPGCSALLAVPLIGLLTFGTWHLLGRGWGLLLLTALAALLLVVKAGERQIEKEEAEAREAHARLVAEHERTVAEHDELERERVQSGPVWFPLRSQTGVLQLQVFGGEARSAEDFILCVGSSALADEQSVLVVDMTRSGVAGKLLASTRSWGRATIRTYQLPRDVDVLLGTVDDVPDYVADALVSARGTRGEHRRSAYANLLHLVCRCLSGPVTLARLAEGLRLLQRIVPGPDTRLDDAEQQRLLEFVDSLGSSEAQRDRVEYLCDELEALARVASEPTCTRINWQVEHPVLTVLSTADLSRGRKPVADALAGQFVLNQLLADAGVEGTLLLAGADVLDPGVLHDLQAEAHRRGVRLICLFEHLHDDALHRLGPPGVAVAFMQLGSHKDAVEAAEFIGRGHKYVLSQLTHSVGETRSVGHSTTQSATVTQSVTTTANWATAEGRGGRSGTEGGSVSVGDAHADTRGVSHSDSLAHTTNSGSVEARVYEFEVEPTTLQSLPPAALLLVDNGPGGRRVVAGTCNCAVAATARLSALPIEDVDDLKRAEQPRRLERVKWT